MNVVAVSCNFTIKRGDTNLWADLRDRYVRQEEIDLFLHLGDQIYGDHAFHDALEILAGKPPAAKDPKREERILELYRRLYRLAWNDPATQEVLASVPNLMIWDDHEIRDDWGSFDSDNDPQSAEYYVGTLARRVFREYQRQLWDDFDPEAEPTSGFEHHCHAWGPIGVLFVDQRGGRSFQRDAARPYLGTTQWKAIKEALAPGGRLSSVRALLVVTSVPLAYLSTRISQAGSRFMDDLMDHWAYGPHRKEQIEMIRLLRKWKELGKGGRELLVLGGDVHIGGFTDIKHRGNIIFKQLITSPITNRPPKWYEFYGVRLLMETHESLGQSYSFEHHDFTNRRNYGVIVVRVPSPRRTPKVEGTLVEAV
jgi:phosphodiesterase/alkaline phosphatase D-like protein